MPVNWILLLYFSVGLIHLIRLFLKFLGLSQLETSENSFPKQQNGKISEPGKNKLRAKSLILGMLLPILVGLFVTATMVLIQPRYADQNREELIQSISKNPAWNDSPSKRETVLNMLRGGEMIIEKGVAFYPRFYDSGEGEPTRRDSAYQAREFPRLVFTFIGSENREIVFPIKESPHFFPNGTEVIIVYQVDSEGNIDPLFMNLIGESPMLYFKDSFLLKG